MMISAELVRSHIAYTAWASASEGRTRDYLPGGDWAAGLTDEAAQLEVSYKDMRGCLPVAHC